MNKIFHLTATALCFFILESCDKNDNILTAPIPPSIKQVDMTIMIPIHPTSLKYFDFVISYHDNEGNIFKDTLHYSGGIDVDGPISSAYDITKHLYRKTFCYRSLPVSCTANVEMIPNFDGSSMASFTFYVPKPYIYSNIFFSESPIDKKNTDKYFDSIDINMSIDQFKKTYGVKFTSHSNVSASDSGYEVDFY